MQRAAALNPTTEAATPSSPSATTTPARASTSTSTGDGSTKGDAKESKIVFVDGNEEHWSFADPSTSTATTAEPEGSSSSGSGWNSWLLQASASSSKGKHREGKGSHSESAPSTSNGLGPVGRRKFGTFEGEEKKGSEGGGKKKDGASSSAEGAAGRDRAEKKRPSTSREWSLEPDLDVDQDAEHVKRADGKGERHEAESKSIRGNYGAARYHRGDQTGARQEGKKAKKARKSLDVSSRPDNAVHPAFLVAYHPAMSHTSQQ